MFQLNPIWARKDGILIVLTTRQVYFVLLNAHLFFRWKRYPLLKWFCKAKFAQYFLVFCLSCIWTFDIDIISISWVDDNAKCDLADHIDPVVRDSPTLPKSLKGSNRRLKSIWISQSLWFIVPLKNVSILWRPHHYRLRASNFYLRSAFIVIEHWRFFSGPNLVWHLLSMYNGKNPCWIMNVIWTYTDLWWKGMGFDFF